MKFKKSSKAQLKKVNLGLLLKIVKVYQMIKNKHKHGKMLLGKLCLRGTQEFQELKN